MLQVPDKALPPDTSSALTQMQADIDLLPTYAQRVTEAKSRFKSKSAKVFDVVRATLSTMCGPELRCMYCEDSACDEVEHVRPKDLYPEVVFAWMNYLYACGPCNSPKGNKFAVHSSRTGAVVDVARAHDALVVEPEAGTPLLIDPRTEDPLLFMRLDLRDTFHFRPMHRPMTVPFERARYTIRTLHLNDRAHLAAARFNAYQGYIGMLHRYVDKKKESAAPDVVARTLRALKGTRHPTVWAEMKRQQEHIAELRELFQEAPEAMGW